MEFVNWTNGIRFFRYENVRFWASLIFDYFIKIKEKTKSMEFFKKSTKKAYFDNLKHHKWLIALSVFIGLATVILFYTNRGVLEIFQNFIYASFPLFILYLVISLTIQVFLIIRWKLILKTHGHSVPFRKLWIYRTIGYSLNYFTPTAHVGGEPIRALLLKRYKVPFPKGLSSVLLDKSLEISMNSFFASIGVIIMVIIYGINTDSMLVILGAIVLMALMIYVYYKVLSKGFFLNAIIDKFRKANLFKNYVKEIKVIKKHVFAFYSKHKREFKISVLISTILWFLMFLEYKIALLMLGYDAKIVELFLIITVVGFAYLIPIPAALGILEISQVSIFRFLNISVSKGIALSFLIRSRDTFISLIGMAFLFYKSFKFKTLFHRK
ncbi:hypothetical protein BVX95_01400 [archaeon D22]|nr:hypothetical protein BVX95_01400 [archaeon D22]